MDLHVVSSPHDSSSQLKSTLPHQVLNHGPSSTYVIVLLVLVLVSVIADITLRFGRTQSKTPLTTANTPPQMEVETVSNLANKACLLMKDLHELERLLPRKFDKRQRHHRKYLITHQPYDTEYARQTQRIQYAELQRSAGRMGFDIAALGKRDNSPAFLRLCERLLVTNHVWKLQREIRGLRAELEAQGHIARANALRSFCENLLLANTFWKMERGVKELISAKVQRSQIDDITQVMKQVVGELGKELAAESDGTVKDLTREVEEAKRQLVALKAAHEQQIDELNNEWIKEYRLVVRENEKLRLGQEAKLVEQQVANELEQTLFEKLEGLKDDNGEDIDHSRCCSSHAHATTSYEEPDDMDTTLVSSISTLTCTSTGSRGRVRDCCKFIESERGAYMDNARARRHSMPPERIGGMRRRLSSASGSSGRKTPVWRP